MVHVDRLREDDWAVFREIRLRSLLDSPDAFGSTYGEESSDTERAWRDWAAGRWRAGIAAVFIGRAEDGTPVGTATGAEFESEPGIGHVYAMWVAPDARSAGVGRALLDGVESWARGRACRRLTLRVTETNAAARGFYVACGFIESEGRTPLREGSRLHVVTMTKELR
jgi:GNAT superfamily N-acetyltransferase